MNGDVAVVLGVAILITLCFVALGMVLARAKAELDAMALKLSDLGQELVRFDNELGAVAREGYDLRSKFEDHLLSLKPPARKAPAKKAAAKKAPAKRATPAKKAPRQRSVS